MITARVRRNLLMDAFVIVAGVAAAVILARTGILDAILQMAVSVEAAAFVAGVFFTSVFTIAPASVALARLAATSSLPTVALWGALGAVVGDLLIFYFIRDRFSEDLMKAIRPTAARRFLASFHLGFLRWLSPAIGALIIASPLPDELGIALMGLSRTSVNVLIPISFAMNWLGIYLIAIFAGSI